MKRLFHLLVITIILFSSTGVYANDINDLLRGLKSPEVDYHVDEDIKTIVIQPKPTINTPKESEAQSLKKEKTTKDEDVKEEKKDISTNTSNESGQKDKVGPTKDSKQKEKVTSNNSQPHKNPLSDIATKIAKETTGKQNKNTVAKSKPIKIYSLFLFFKKMPFIQTWQNNIVDNLAFCRILTENVFDFWMEIYQKEKEEEEKEDDDEEEDDEEEEEETPVDYSKYAPIIAKAKSFCDENQWSEIKKLFEENPESSEAPDAKPYLLLAELNDPKMDLGRLRSYANDVYNQNSNDPNANYALALCFYKNPKKKDTKKALQHINIALKAKNPPKGALELSKQIQSSNLLIYIIIGIIILSIAAFVIIKKKKAKSVINLDAPESPTNEVSESQKPENKLLQKLAPIKSKLEPIISKIKTAVQNIFNKIKKKKAVEIDASTLPTTENSSTTSQEEVEEIIVEVDENGNEVIIEEVPDDGSGAETSEEIIEEIVEDSSNASDTEIVEEEIIEEIEEKPEEELVEEIIEEEEIEEEIEDEEGTSSISEESLLKE